MQIATKDRVYLFDMICLVHDLTDDDWTWFGEKVFTNNNIIKLGELRLRGE